MREVIVCDEMSGAIYLQRIEKVAKPLAGCSVQLCYLGRSEFLRIPGFFSVNSSGFPSHPLD